MHDHKTRAKARCMAICNAPTCQCVGACAGQQFDPLLGPMPAWWDHLPDGGGARREALADLMGRQMMRSLEQGAAPF